PLVDHLPQVPARHDVGDFVFLSITAGADTERGCRVDERRGGAVRKLGGFGQAMHVMIDFAVPVVAFDDRVSLLEVSLEAKLDPAMSAVFRMPGPFAGL